MISKRHKGRLFRVLSKLVLLLAMGNVTSAQNFVAGPMGVYGDTYATFTILTNSNLVIGAGGNWALGGSITSSPRSLANGVAFANQGTYAAATTYQYIDGYVSQTGNTAFTFPLGDAAATSGGAYHPLALNTLSAVVTASTIYIASSSTPHAASLGASVGKVDPVANWSFSSTAATGTVTISTRDESGVLGAGGIFVVGYNTATNVWDKLGTATTILTGGQNLVTTAGINLANYSAFTAASTDIPYIIVNAKVLLQGPLSGTTMGTSLNSLNLIPLAQPYNLAPFGAAASGYAGSETVTRAFLQANPNIVDWVLVELRDPTTPANIIASRAAFLQNDGTLLDTNGAATVKFYGTAVGSYFVAIRHRNHLGVRTASALSITSDIPTLYDFTGTMANANGTNPMKAVGSVFAMWAGNVNGDTRITNNANPSDASAVSNIISTASGNTLHSPSFVLTNVYSIYDVDLNGSVRNSALPSDRTLIINNVATHPANILHNSSYFILEQL